MIVDRLENWSKTFKGDAWRRSFEFLASANASMPASRIDLDGDNVYAMIQELTTVDPAQGNIETHRDYVDIHMLLSDGIEGIDWSPAPALKPKGGYNPEKDQILYEHPERPAAHLLMRPGMFVVLYPQDAHSAKVHPDRSPVSIKKVVIKLRASLA